MLARLLSNAIGTRREHNHCDLLDCHVGVVGRTLRNANRQVSVIEPRMAF